MTTYSIYGLTGLLSEFATDTSLLSASAAASTDRFQYRVGEQTGTAVLLLDANGTVVHNNRVFPFGEDWQSTDSGNDQKFTTYQRDGESALDYAMARYYAYASGRFMTPDPGHVGANVGDPQSWNAYVYVGNDPLNSTDPTGMFEGCGGLWCDPMYIALLLFTWYNSEETDKQPPPVPPIEPPRPHRPHSNPGTALPAGNSFVTATATGLA
jgi:RHS repeat-associated protein